MRESWGSQLGFAFAAMGSAIGLANIIRFPYLVGKHGGAAFIIVYLICLLLVSMPTFIAEIAIGQKSQRSPYGSFKKLGEGSKIASFGKWQVITALIVSAFYGVLASWVFGYFCESVLGNTLELTTVESAKLFHQELLSSFNWTASYHLLFILACGFIVFSGLRDGLEKFSKFFMPLLFMVLIAVLIYSLMLPNSGNAISFLLQPDWSAITPGVVLIALGQSFFTLSAGQGTMITYGSYLKPNEDISKGMGAIVLSDTIVSILAAVIVYSIVISAGMDTTGDLGMLFQTLPVIFAGMGHAGLVLGCGFFLLVLLAAITSELSAIEPVVAYVQERYELSRQKSVMWAMLLIYILGIPCMLATNVLAAVVVKGHSIMDLYDFIATSIMIPVGALLSVVLLGWVWKPKEIITGSKSGFYLKLDSFIRCLVKYLAPVVIVLIAFNSIFG